MRRTYKSKKDVGGGLDHRDVLLNLDEKTSAFDAFYIQNIKQTKRDLSSVGPSTLYGAASNRVRKRKYVKRIVKEAEPTRKESLSHSVFLTPDKSMRVNRGLDPFDMLLNSSPAPEPQPITERTDSYEKYVPPRPAITYARKKQFKKRNYVKSDSTDSEKENSSDLSTTFQNVTDIKAHKLLVEKEPSVSLKYRDESINNIVKHLAILNNFKQSSNESFNTPKLSRCRLTKSIQSPILQQSPLCSTPFKEKYRGQSIYKFSPIITSNPGSSNSDASQKFDCNDSVVFDYKNNSIKERQFPVKDEAENIDNFELSSESRVIYDSQSIEMNEQANLKEFITQGSGVQNKDINDKIATVLTDSNTVPANEISSLQITKMEPFLGFTIIDTEDLINKRNKIEALCNNDTEINLYQYEQLDQSYFNDSQSIKEPQNSIHSAEKEIVNDNSIGNTSSDVDSNDNESMYDTCDSEPLSEKNVSKEPIVRMERMSDSLFLKYYEIMTENLLDVKNTEDGETFDGSSKDNTFEKSPNSTFNRSDFGTELTDEVSSCDTTNVSTVEDATTCHDTASSSSNEEQYISFVTTRRRNEFAGKSVVSFFDDSYGSGELEKTVLSNTNIQQKTDFNQSNAVDLNSCEINAIKNERRTSTVKRRRRRYSKSSINIDTSVHTDSDDISKEVTLYSLPTTAEDSVDSFTKQRKSLHRRSIRKSRKNEVTRPKSSIDVRNSNVDLEKLTSDEATSASDTISDSPAVCIDSDDVMISNVDTEVSVDAEENNHKVTIEHSVNIASSVSGSSDNENKITLHAVPPNKIGNITESGNLKISITTRKSSKLSRSSTLTEREAKYQRSSKNTNNVNINKCDDAVTRNKPSISTERTSTVTTRKPSRVLNEMDTNKSLHYSKTVGELPGIVLQPGKKWERSLSIYKRMTMMTDSLDHSILDESMQMKGRKYRQSVISTMEMQDMRGSVHNDSINSRRSTFLSKPSRSTIRIVKDFNSSRTSLYNTADFDDLKGFLADDCDDTIVELSKLSIADAEPEVTVLELHETSNRLATARDYVLRRCNQTDAILFDECYPDTVLKNCHKIGEGVYGEVFLWRDRDGRARVMKIVPIAGNIKVNGENQKDFSEIISEIVIAMELSALRAPIADIERHLEGGNDASALDLHSVENATDVFNEVLAVRCVYGGYPSRLLDLWDLYDECKGSENDNPAILPVDQQYIVLELANAGQDLESYQFNNAEQAYALFYQIAFGLAVGEEAYQFEHRDLHWGNVLIAPTEQKFATFILRGRAHSVPRRGVSATIIDYSLSRLALPLTLSHSHSHSHSPSTHTEAAAALYNDLSTDEGLFDAVGDYQFQVYRLMRDKLGNDWKNFEPYTNILWLHYTVDKMITALRYKRTNTKIHKHYIEKLKGIKNRILEFKSAVEFVLVDNEY